MKPNVLHIIKQRMPFNLEKVCKNCKPESIKKYKRDILRLKNLNSGTQNRSKEVPETASWLKAKPLFDKYKKLPLEKRRALSIAAVKCGQAYGLKENKKWYDAMLSDINLYKKKRSQQNKSEVEKSKWLEGGLKTLKKASTEYKREIRRLLAENTLKSLYAYSKYLILRFYSEVALRNTLADVEISSGENHISKKKGVFTLKLTKFKVSEKVGPVEIPLSRALSTAITKYVKYRSQFKLDHKFLLVNAAGKKLSRKALGIILQKLSKKYTGKAVGSRMVRIFKATENKAVIDRALKVSKQMLHKDLKMTASYARK